MKRHKILSVGDIFAQFIQGTELEKNLLEKQVIQSWPKVMGNMVANLTGKIEMKNGVLFVQICSAALRQQLFECRYDVLKKINQEINSNFVKDIRFIG
jgi:hypothetical protein